MSRVSIITENSRVAWWGLLAWKWLQAPAALGMFRTEDVVWYGRR